jgi:hypothetical protein
MLQADSGADRAAPETWSTRPPREHRGVRELVIAVLLIAATTGVALFVALVVVPSAGAAGGCGGG